MSATIDLQGNYQYDPHELPGDAKVLSIFAGDSRVNLYFYSREAAENLVSAAVILRDGIFGGEDTPRGQS